MPYDSKENLPDRIRDNLPDHAQDIFIAAYNNAWEQYKDPEDRQGDAGREETARRIAWSAVKDQYRKTEEGWVEKEG